VHIYWGTPVMSVIKYLLARVNGIYINVYILVSVHIAVMFVISIQATGTSENTSTCTYWEVSMPCDVCSKTFSHRCVLKRHIPSNCNKHP
jgi:hypothetical protein